MTFHIDEMNCFDPVIHRGRHSGNADPDEERQVQDGITPDRLVLHNLALVPVIAAPMSGRNEALHHGGCDCWDPNPTNFSRNGVGWVRGTFSIRRLLRHKTPRGARLAH